MARKAQVTKVCTKSGKSFPATPEFFYRDKSQKDGLSPWSKEAERSYNKAYYAGLKAAKASKVATIATPKAKKAFEATMSGERVTRKSRKGATVATKATKASPTRKRTTKAKVVA